MTFTSTVECTPYYTRQVFIFIQYKVYIEMESNLGNLTSFRFVHLWVFDDSNRSASPTCVFDRAIVDSPTFHTSFYGKNLMHMLTILFLVIAVMRDVEAERLIRSARRE